MDNSVKFKIELETNGKKVLGDLSVEATDFRKAVETAVDETKRLSGSIDKMTKYAVLFSSMKTVVDQLAGAVSNLAAEYNSFDKSLRAVNTMAGKDKAGMAEMKREVEELAAAIPLAKDELANGLYQVISNGVPEDNWIEFLNRSARSAVGGIADLGQTVTVTSTIIKNYGMEWSAAGDIQDKIQMTAKNGVTSFEQLAAALPRVTGNAATLGVSIDELLATFATLTGVSGNTAEVSTQLAAVFTSLVRPTSEAAEMAAEMGIQFDAAAIKAAGGMQNFLMQLTADVQQYAVTHGMLEQEIFGRLFGSAEALRALIPLTGELADKYETNVAAMADSTGTIDAAFADMAGSGESVTQTLKNQVSTWADWAGSIASAINPYVSFIAVSGQALAGTVMMTSATKKLLIETIALVKVHKSNVAVQALSAIHTKMVALAQRMLSASSVSATAGTWALNAAVTALYATLTLGIGAVIGGLVALFSSLGDKADEAGEKIDVLADSNEAYSRTVADTKAELAMEISSLRTLIQQHGDEATKIEELNRRYGSIFGTHSTAAEWYKILTAKSQAYCQQLGYEAQARILASQKAAKELERDRMLQRKMELEQQHMDNRGHIYRKYEQNSTLKDEYNTLIAKLGQVNNTIRTTEAQFNTCIKKMAEAQSQLAVKTEKTTTEVRWQEMSYNDLGKAIDKQKSKVGKYIGVDPVKAKEEVAVLKQMEAQHRKMGETYGLVEKRTMKADTTIKTDNSRQLIDNAVSYQELSNNIAYYREQLERTAPADTDKIERLKALLRAAEEAREAIAKLINTTEEGVEAAPAAIGQLDTIDKLNEAISYYQKQQRNASAGEITDIQRTVEALQAKQRALMQLTEIPSMQSEVSGLDGLDDKQLKIKLDLIGLDTIKTKLATLRALLADTQNPLGDEQRAELEGLIQSYSTYVGVLSNTVSKGDQVAGMIGNLGAIMGNLSGVVGEGAAGWLSYGANILSAVAQALPMIAQLIGGNIAQAFSGAIAQSQSVPFPYNLISLAASLASVGAAVASIPKFANGGIAYGPTVGLFGEYVGARSNPEVVAPLNRLRDMITPANPAGDVGVGRVEFVIDGRVLRGVLDKNDRMASRTR